MKVGRGDGAGEVMTGDVFSSTRTEYEVLII